MRVPRYSALVCLLIATGASSVHADVELQPKERENLGIQVETVTLVDAARTWPAAASVIDVSGLVTAINELQTAEAAASASRDEARRSSDLYRNDTNVSRKALDAAQSQSIADEGRVTTARAQLLAAWGSPLASMSAPARRQLVDDLLAGRAVLVRAEVLLPMPSGAQITQARLTEINGEENWPATVLGRLPQGAGAMFSAAVLLRVNASLPTGQLLQATLTESQSRTKGPSVPLASIVRWHGAEWVYEESEPNHFVRRAVRSTARAEGRALLEGEISPNAKVVTVGARALLGAELTPPSPADEAGGRAAD